MLFHGLKSPGDLGNLGGMSLGFSSPVFWVSISLNVVFLVILRWGTIYGCRKCDVLIFVPLNTTANIIFSVATGMICLAEYTSAPGFRLVSHISPFFSTFFHSLFPVFGERNGKETNVRPRPEKFGGNAYLTRSACRQCGLSGY